MQSQGFGEEAEAQEREGRRSTDRKESRQGAQDLASDGPSDPDGRDVASRRSPRHLRTRLTRQSLATPCNTDSQSVAVGTRHPRSLALAASRNVRKAMHPRKEPAPNVSVRWTASVSGVG